MADDNSETIKAIGRLHIKGVSTIKQIAQPAPSLPKRDSIPNAPPQTVKKITLTKAKKFSRRDAGITSEIFVDDVGYAVASANSSNKIISSFLISK
jgi:hypothetical protein